NNNNDKNDRTEEQTTTEEDDRSSNCNLKSLQISPGTLEPAFSPSITSYYVQVDEDVTSMVVSAVAEDENAATAVRGAGLIEPGANTVTITVTAENGAVKVYTLSVAAGEVLGDAKTTIDGIDYDFVQSSNDLEIPEGYSEIKTEYKEWEVLAFESPNKKIVLVCLKPNVENDEDDRQEWFMYDKDKESFIPYREYSSEFNRYVIIEAPEGKIIPEGFEKTEIDIGGIGEKVIAYKSNDINDKDIYLVYAVNIAGDEGFYWYDTKEKAFLRYAEKEVVETDVEVATETMATPAEPEIIEEKTSEKEGFFSNKTLGVMAIIFGVLAFIFLVVIIILSAMLKAKGNEEDAFEDEEAFSSEENSKVSGELSDKDISENNNDLADTDGLLDESAENRIENNELTEEMAYEEARRAYEEDREISHSIPASFDLSNMQDDKTVEDRNIQIMSFKKPEKKEVISEDKSDSSSEKENDKNIVETEKEKDTQTDTQINEVTEMEEIETIKFDFSKSDTEVKEDEELRKDYENDYAKQSEAINEKIKNGYDAEKDSAFSDDSDE
ncbi:MAG: cadherin-like beta sandwich domain-containing protein, partial [Lachnospiraceae bacterium]|nr:cadherin-like beta sandwich domain-containing protein [Lachnospiraceae bacterium]